MSVRISIIICIIAGLIWLFSQIGLAVLKRKRLKGVHSSDRGNDNDRRNDNGSCGDVRGVRGDGNDGCNTV